MSTDYFSKPLHGIFLMFSMNRNFSFNWNVCFVFEWETTSLLISSIQTQLRPREEMSLGYKTSFHYRCRNQHPQREQVCLSQLSITALRIRTTNITFKSVYKSMQDLPKWMCLSIISTLILTYSLTFNILTALMKITSDDKIHLCFQGIVLKIWLK